MSAGSIDVVPEMTPWGLNWIGIPQRAAYRIASIDNLRTEPAPRERFLVSSCLTTTMDSPPEYDS